MILLKCKVLDSQTRKSDDQSGRCSGDDGYRQATTERRESLGASGLLSSVGVALRRPRSILGYEVMCSSRTNNTDSIMLRYVVSTTLQLPLILDALLNPLGPPLKPLDVFQPTGELHLTLHILRDELLRLLLSRPDALCPSCRLLPCCWSSILTSGQLCLDRPRARPLVQHLLLEHEASLNLTKEDGAMRTRFQHRRSSRRLVLGEESAELRDAVRVSRLQRKGVESVQSSDERYGTC